MLELQLSRPARSRPLRILCLGAHCDDIEIGCGGTLLHLLSARRPTEVTWVAFSAAAIRRRELEASARRFLRRAVRRTLIAHEFRDSYFPGQYVAIKQAFEPLKALVKPDIIFTHQCDDRHQDHQLIGELTWNAFRDQLILEYEIPKYEGGLRTPVAYVGLRPGEVERKIRLLMECYGTQRSKRWFAPESFRGLMRLRGIESGSPFGWAEGFHARKLLLA
jgi:LmbE family N-acetylglucosaminyl deacetylase